MFSLKKNNINKSKAISCYLIPHSLFSLSGGLKGLKIPRRMNLSRCLRTDPDEEAATQAKKKFEMTVATRGIKTRVKPNLQKNGRHVKLSGLSGVDVWYTIVQINSSTWCFCDSSIRQHALPLKKCWVDNFIRVLYIFHG